MKRFFVTIFLSLGLLSSFGALAAKVNIGIVDMKLLFQSSPQAKAINNSLRSQFSSRKANIVKLGQQLQNEVKKYEKNQSIMNKKTLTSLQKTINEHSVRLRQEQSKFRTDLLAAQNKKMNNFLIKVKTAVAKVAVKKGIKVVVPDTALLYSEQDLDITQDVLKVMG